MSHDKKKAWRLKKGVLGQDTKRSDWVTSAYFVVDEVRDKICRDLNVRPTLDAFASSLNHRFPRYWSKVDGDDAFHHNWRDEDLLWINAPFELYPKVLDRLKEDRARAVVVCPAWTHLKWFREMQRYMVRQVVVPRGIRIFQREGEGGMPLRQRKWETVAMLVDMGQETPPEPLPTRPPRCPTKKPDDGYRTG